MSIALRSNWWYRVADRKPKLRSHARLHRHRYRGDVWYLLQDPGSARVHRFTPAARLVIALMDGTRTVERLWEHANKHLGEDAPTQDEMIQLLGQLHAADLIESDVTPDIAELFTRSEREEKARALRSYGNPMAIRIALWDPDAFLNRFRAAIGLVWSRWGLGLWLAVVLPAFFLIWPHWPELSHNFSDRVLALDNLFTLYLTFPVIKLLHELGHASAVKAGGGEVHDLGIILLVLLPVPYVEASGASVFKSKHQRAVVGAAGVAVELFVAALCFYLWLLVDPGVVRAVLFNVMVIASISSVVFNGNPLLRYDAYYILADLIEIPNLGARSSRYWGYLLQRYGLGIYEIDPPDATASEKAWFVCYGLASAIYRILVTFVIAFFIAGRFFVIGVLLAIWAVGAMAVVPIVKAIRHVGGNPRLRRHRGRAALVVAGGLSALVAVLFLVPMPYHSRAEGVLWLPEQAIVRATENGFLFEFLVPPGTTVRQGDVLAQSHNPALEALLGQSEGKVAELQAEYTAQYVTDRAKAEVIREKLEGERATLRLVQARAADLLVHANTDGVFVSPQMEDMPGRFFKKGELLGYVIGEVRPIVRVVIPQDANDKVRLATDRVTVRLVDHPETVLQGRLLREVPGGEDYLPSYALAIEGGGEIPVDPRETKGPKALQRMFQFDVELPAIRHGKYFGQRVFVRFEHQKEPLGVQWYRSLRLLFMSNFDV